MPSMGFRMGVPATVARKVALSLATVAVCLVLFLIGASASRRFSEPIAELTRAASAVAAGDFARDLPTAGGEEVQLLGGAMQRMKSALNQAVQRAAAEGRLTAMVCERLPDGRGRLAELRLGREDVRALAYEL